MNRIVPFVISLLSIPSSGYTRAIDPVKKDKTTTETTLFYPSAQKEGFIGISPEKKFDSPADNVFEVVLADAPAPGDEVWLTYQLYGLQDHTAVSRSINNQVSVGGYLIQKHTDWSAQKEQIAVHWLKKGSNLVRFTLPEGVDYHYAIKNLGFLVKKGAAKSSRNILINQPETHSYYGETGYVKGFVTGKDCEKARIYIDGKAVLSVASEFEGLSQRKGESISWYSTIKAVFPDGEILEKRVSYTTPQALTRKNTIAPNAALVAENTFIPGKSLQLTLTGASLTVSPDALTGKRNLSITALRPIDIPAMDMGMVNVTKEHGGFRFLPHGTQFAKDAGVALTYDPSKIPQGYTEKDIRTYYFDETTRHWVALKRDSIAAGSHTILSKTGHFTDMINAIIKVPESPETAGFTPTSIKDIKAADPSAGINTVEPPSANNMGTANMSYPITLPAGRQGMQPQLAIQYNSEGDNSWLGMGWNLQLPAITIDTRWGVPRYWPAQETETYSFGGEQLSPVAHRGALQNRSAEKQFYPRVEGGFNRIIRHGDSPTNYWWEVTDKSGTRYFYGGTPASGVDTRAILTDAWGNIAHWALTEVRDTNDNFVRYQYTQVEDAGVQGGTVPGYQLYIARISYTGHQDAEGPYEVIFTRDRDLGESRRADVGINARYGFKQVTADLLRRIDVQFSGQSVRSYELQYTQGAFYKTLLRHLIEYDANGNEFTRHELEYYDEVRNQDGVYEPFTAQENWTSRLDTVSKGFKNPLESFNGDASMLSGSGSDSKTLGVAVTVGINDGKLINKSLTLGGKLGFSISDSEGMLTLVDINGDGLPDKVIANSNGLFYRANLSGPGGNPVFDDNLPPTPITGVTEFSRSNTITGNFGFEAHLGFGTPFSEGFIGEDTMISKTVENTYFSDVNGDGLIDIVSNGKAYYNHIDDNGNPVFTQSSADTPNPIDENSTIDAGIVEIDPAEQEALIDQYPLHDVVKVWEAPFNGIVRITGRVQLKPGAALKAHDGVRVTIQHSSTELWSTFIGSGDHSLITPTGVANIAVTRGDRLYFRVQSVENGANDQVTWTPVVQYTDRPVGLTNANQQVVYRYAAEEGFILTANQTIEAPIDGVLKVEGLFHKPVTSDNLTATITHNGAPLWQQAYTWNQLADAVIDIDVNVSQGDIFQFQVTADTNIDWKALSFSPRMYYTASNDPAYPNVTDAEGEPLLEFHPTIHYSLFPEHWVEGAESRWVSTLNGNVTIAPELAFNGAPNGELTLSVKRANQLVAKQTLTIAGGVVAAIPPLNIAVAVGDVFFIEYHTTNRTLAEAVITARALVNNPAWMNPIRRNVALHTVEDSFIFGPLYRHWGQFAYNGNRERANQPINEADLVLDPEIESYNPASLDAIENPEQDFNGVYNPLESNFVMMIPVAKDQLWRGYDDLTYVTESEISSSRLGMDDISVIDPIPGGENIQAINRVTQSSNFSVAGGAGAFGINAGVSTGDGSTDTQTDFMDMNGDQYPDIVTRSHIQYTLPTGRLEETGILHVLDPDLPDPHNSFNHNSSNHAHGANIGGTYAHSKSNQSLPAGKQNSPITNAKRDPIQSNNAAVTSSSPLGFSGSGSYSENEDKTGHSWLDVNGDGLPDKVYRGGDVALNLGDSFTVPEPWGYSEIKDGVSQDFGVGLGITFGNWSYALGASLSRNQNEANATLQDINGDGLVDIVMKGEPIRVRFNTGNGFGPFIPWTGANTISDGASTGESVNVAFTYCIPLVFPVPAFKLCINPSVTIGQGASREWTRIADIDGDSYPDVLSSRKDDELTVKRSTIGRTNLLRSVRRPLGAEFTVAYARTGNTYNLQNSKWVLSEVVVHDGFNGDGADTMANAFEYEDGYYDRHEREFYGFARVTSRQLDTQNGNAVYRSVVQEFHNQHYYEKGLLAREFLQDGAGNRYTETLNTYQLKDIASGSILPADYATNDAGAAFPALAETLKQFYEGQGAPQKSTQMTYSYDALGNVIGYTDFGDAGAGDDITAQITYHALPALYIMNAPQSIFVNGDGQTYRHRETIVDPATGDVTQIRRYLADGSAAQYDITYDGYGNIASLTRPENATGQRLAFSYSYDPAVHTYTTGITDSYGYSSSAAYDYRFGQLLSTTDLNGQQLQYTLDHAGRVSSITGPLELAVGVPYTIAFEYHPEAGVPWARTRHYDPAHPGNDLETFTFADGLKRPLQVKKDAALYTAPQGADEESMIVSGRVTFDAFGRTTESYYPITEPKGTESDFNPVYDGVAPTTTAYDVLDRALAVTLPDGAVMATDYGFDTDRDGALQFRTRVTDANGIWKQSFTNVRGLTTAVREQYSQGSDIWTSYAYNPINELVAVTDDQNNVISSGYDYLGRRTQVTHPDAGLTTYQYDLADNLTQKVTANLQGTGMGIDYVYDHERLTEIHYPQHSYNNVTYTYGAPGAPHHRAGRIALHQDASGSQEFFYNPLGALVRNTRTVTVPESEPVVYTTEWTYDTWNRVTGMVYPDSETLSYTYNTGGLLHSFAGAKDGTDYNYLTQLGYDKFEQRVYLGYGNGTETFYSYEPLRRRLQHLVAETAANRAMLDNVYSYDNVNNILQVQNLAPTPDSNLMGGGFDYQYTYDDLYRLTEATGSHIGSNHENRYTLAMTYNSVHSILSKNQLHEFKNTGAQNWSPRNETTYTYAYEYGQTQPHAPVHIGERAYTYDANGNQTGWTHDVSGQQRELIWDEENRIASIADNGALYSYIYDASGERVMKNNGQGQTISIDGSQTGNGGKIGNYTIYVNPYVVVRSGQFTKHFYIESQRVVTKLGEGSDGLDLNGNGNGNDLEAFQYYYHPDHLGSSSYITDIDGEVTQHIEYFPFGETFLEEHSNTDRTPYLFNGKELDEETGLYYYGARYYDARTSVWQSVDPPLLDGRYLDGDLNLGIYNPNNLAAYSYTWNNPVKYTDPDGKIVFLPILAAAWAVVEIGLAVYDAYDTVKTLSDPNNSAWEKTVAGGLFVLGAVAPGGGYSAIDDGVEMAIKHGDGAMDAVKTTSNVVENAKKGKNFEGVITKDLKQTGHNNVAEQVTVKPNGGGKNVRLDNVSTKDGQIKLTDAKSSATAPLTKNQKTGYPAIEKSGGTVVGNKGAAQGYPAGTKIPPTKVDIIRPKDIKQ